MAQPQPLTPVATPGTAYIPISPAGRPDTKSLPLWIRTVEFIPSGRDFLGKNSARFRVRFPDVAPPDEEMIVRLIFDDLPESRPIVSAWDEIGNEIAASDPLGTGAGLPASETIVVMIEGANYLEVEVPGSGQTLHGIFLSRVVKKMIRQSLDLTKDNAWEEPFNGVIPLPPTTRDSLLFGTVTASLLNETVRLDEKNSTLALEFELQRKPLAALVSFEILNASVEEPVSIGSNKTPLGPAAYRLPDLADPAYRGKVKPLIDGMRFQYAGWLQAQKLIPANLLKTGLNDLVIGLPRDVDPAAVRSVQIQLKYFWEKIDYEIRP